MKNILLRLHHTWPIYKILTPTWLEFIAAHAYFVIKLCRTSPQYIPNKCRKVSLQTLFFSTKFHDFDPQLHPKQGMKKKVVLFFGKIDCKTQDLYQKPDPSVTPHFLTDVCTRVFRLLAREHALKRGHLNRPQAGISEALKKFPHNPHENVTVGNIFIGQHDLAFNRFLLFCFLFVYCSL